MNRSLIVVSAVLGFLGVVLGAFGSHGLQDTVTESMLAVWQTATYYHLFHTLAILFLSGVTESLPKTRITAFLFLGGILVFSGSLYLYVLTGSRGFAMITPIGGVLFLLGWAWLALSTWTGRKAGT